MVRLALRHFFFSLGAIFLILGLFFLLTPHSLTNILTKLTSTPVSLKKISLSQKELSIQNLTVNNPKGYDLPIAIKVGTIDFKAPLYTYLSPNIIIDEVTLSDIDLDIEYSNTSNSQGNWLEIMKNVDRLLDHQKHHKTHFKGRVVKINQLILKNLKITVIKYKKAPKQLTLPYLQIKHIATQRGAPFDQIAHTLIQEIVTEVSHEIGEPNMLESIAIVPTELIQMVFEPFSLLFGSSSD